MKHVRTPLECCQEYAIAHAESERLTEIMRGADCSRLAKWRERLTKDDAEYVSQPEKCIADHFRVRMVYTGCDTYTEVRDLSYDACCPTCRAVIDAIEERKKWRSKLGSAKRSILHIGRKFMECNANGGTR